MPAYTANVSVFAIAKLRRENSGRQHRLPDPPLVADEECKRGGATGERRDKRGARPTVPGLVD